jgi:hypothetical protein
VWYYSMLGAAKQLVAKEGTRALWAGVGPACIRLSAGAGLYFVVLNKLRQAFGADGAWPAPAPAPAPFPSLGSASLEPAPSLVCTQTQLIRGAPKRRQREPKHVPGGDVGRHVTHHGRYGAVPRHCRQDSYGTRAPGDTPPAPPAPTASQRHAGGSSRVPDSDLGDSKALTTTDGAIRKQP